MCSGRAWASNIAFVLRAGPGLDILFAGRAGPGLIIQFAGRARARSAQLLRARASNHICGPGLGLHFRPVQGPSAGHIKRASESETSAYENCSSSDDSLGTDVGHLPMKPYIIVHAMQSLTLLKMLIHYGYQVRRLTGCDRQQQTVNSGLSRHYF